VLSAIAGAKNLPWRPANAGLAFESTNHLAEVIQLWRRRGVTASHWSRKCPARFEITAIAAIIGLYPRRRDAALPVGLAKRYGGLCRRTLDRSQHGDRRDWSQWVFRKEFRGVEPATGSCPVREARHDSFFSRIRLLCSQTGVLSSGAPLERRKDRMCNRYRQVRLSGPSVGNVTTVLARAPTPMSCRGRSRGRRDWR
jgi:hypothetical protein